MTLPVAPNAITMSQIQTEFGGSNPISLSEYYGVYPGVPGSGEIAMGDFHGLNANLITVTEGTDTDYGGCYGFDDGTHGGAPVVGPMGSRSPTSWNGVTLEAAYWLTNFTFFYIVFQGNRAKSFFTSVAIEGIGTKTSASAYSYFYDSPTNATYWYWVTAQGGWNGSGTRTLTFA